MIIDTDILIWYLRGNEKARILIEQHIPFSMSVVTYMELVQGMINKAECRIFQKQIKQWNTNVIQIDHDISSRAMFYVHEYALSHSMMMADASSLQIQLRERLKMMSDKLPMLLDNPANALQDQINTLNTLANGPTTASYLLVDHLSRYLTIHLTHPHYLALRCYLITILSGVNDFQSAAQQAQEVYPLSVGTEYEHPLILALADNLFKMGDSASAVRLLTGYVSYCQQDPQLMQQALIYALSAADNDSLRRLMPVMVKQNATITDRGILALYCLCRTAVQANDSTTTQHWLTIMNTVAAEHRLSGMARRMVKNMKPLATPATL